MNKKRCVSYFTRHSIFVCCAYKIDQPHKCLEKIHFINRLKYEEEKTFSSQHPLWIYCDVAAKKRLEHTYELNIIHTHLEFVWKTSCNFSLNIFRYSNILKCKKQSKFVFIVFCCMSFFIRSPHPTETTLRVGWKL